ncbi:CoA transferase [Streptomyces meridianus]|uniref:CoA transferase n=1 Tax=Streptomyces meridianus TaxID=2938945 RepID=A0ABT0XEF1_9ACTN|nr:CoA transferase [Streptomyces meridianus]MCM2580189.1 CoA transferase [Streptomyces meridianus]
MTRSTAGTTTAWTALGGDPELPERIVHDGPRNVLPSRLPVAELARSCVAVCALAAAEASAHRTGCPVPSVTVDDGAVAAAFVSERLLRIDGRAPETFAPLSRFWHTADGTLRTHANYPHHRERLLAALGVPDGPGTAERVAAELAALPVREAEQRIHAADGLAVAVRTPQQWSASAEGRAAASGPLVRIERTEDGRAGTAPAPAGVAADPGRPAAGLRVLDLTRVLAGPVATRTLALYGADVLRIDSPRLPESADLHADTGFGKRSAVLDLGSRSGRATFDELLAAADVVVTGYRPGALDRHGLAPQELAERRPGLVIAQLSAWGSEGPWAGRRGFDSLVQAACGIAVVERKPDGSPGALPAQALDHGTGYLIAAAVLRMLTERTDFAGTLTARFALARTAAWLTDELAPGTGPVEGDSPDPVHWTAETPGPLGTVRHALPPARFDGSPQDWATPPVPWGTSETTWRS